MKKTKTNKAFIATGIAVVSLLILCLSVFAQPFRAFQLKFSDNLYSASTPSNKIVIVDIDERTINQQAGLGDLSTWSRSNYAKVLNEISKHEPAAVGIDILFAQQRDTEGDNQLTSALEQSEKTVLIASHFASPEDEDQSISRFITPFNQIMELREVTIALASLTPDADEKIRRTGESYSSDINYYDPFPVAVVKLFDEKLISGLDASKGFIINFFSDVQANRYERISFLDLYNGTIDESKLDELIGGNIVLIGASAKKIGDLYFTPTSGINPMPGVEIHANAIQTILDQKFLREMTTFEDILMLLVICLGAGFVFMFTRIRWSLAALMGSLVSYTLLAPLVFKTGLILDVIHPYLAIVMMLVGIYLYRYLTEFRAKNELKSAFSKYVNPKIVSEIMEDPDKLKLGGEKREITVLFTDIAHFTSISEKLKPESLVALLNEYLDEMTKVIMEAGGTVDKFEGDAIMAFFGAPVSQEDHVQKACDAALNMRLKLQQLMKKWANDEELPGGEKKPEIDFRCGINSGEAIVGNVGAQDHLNYTAIGDAVNLASRLEGANKQYETNLMVSEFTQSKCSENFVFRELDLIKVVGKEQPVKVFELLGHSEGLSNEAKILLNLYNQGMDLYHERKFAEAKEKFEEILASFPTDGPSKLYVQRCEILRNFPPKDDWNGVFEMRSK